MVELENIRWMIKKSGLSYAEIAAKIGVHENTIRRIATDQNYNPTYKNLRLLLNYFRS